jgi:hypothetical protein
MYFEEVRVMLKISFLGVYNFLGLESYELDPKHINLVSGGNGQGKTSLIDSIYKGIYNDCPRPVIVRNGADQAMILVKLQDENGEEIEIKRTIDAEDSSKDSIKVIKDGISQARPETLLKALMGKYTFGFNPVSFLQLKDKDQTDILLGLLPIFITKEMLQSWFKDEKLFPEGIIPPVNTNLHGLQVCKDLANDKGGHWYEKRKVVNSEIATLQSECDALGAQLPNNYNPEEWRSFDLLELSKKIQEAIQINTNRQTAQFYIDTEKKDLEAIDNKAENAINASNLGSEATIQQIRQQIAVLEAEIRNLEKQKEDNKIIINGQRGNAITSRKANTKKSQEYIAANPEVKIDPLNEEFKTAEEMKGYIALADKSEELNKKLIDKNYEATVYNRFVDISRSKPAELLRSVTLPVEGLGINDAGNITIHGLPIKNLSTSEQVRIALEIARNTCGDLKLICVDKFEHLDPEVQKMFFEQIAKDDFQYFVTDISREYDSDGRYMGELRVTSVGD